MLNKASANAPLNCNVCRQNMEEERNKEKEKFYDSDDDILTPTFTLLYIPHCLNFLKIKIIDWLSYEEHNV